MGSVRTWEISASNLNPQTNEISRFSYFYKYQIVLKYQSYLCKSLVYCCYTEKYFFSFTILELWPRYFSQIIALKYATAKVSDKWPMSWCKLRSLQGTFSYLLDILIYQKIFHRRIILKVAFWKLFLFSLLDCSQEVFLEKMTIMLMPKTVCHTVAADSLF